MIVSKLYVGIAAAFAGALAFGFVWQVREAAHLESELTRQSAAAAAEHAALEQKIAEQTERVAAAEAEVAALLNAAEAEQSRLATPAAKSTTLSASDAANAAMARAAQLIKEGSPEAAVEEYVKCYRELRAIRLGSPESQRLMGALTSLGKKHPPALAVLADLRDAATAEFREASAPREVAIEIALLNERLGEGQLTLTVYDALPADDAVRRRALARIAFNSFAAARRYDDALLGKSAGQMLALIDSGAQHLPKMDPTLQDRARKQIVDNTLTHIEVLTGAGKADDAQLLTEKLFAFDNSEITRDRLRQRLARTETAKSQ